MTNALIGVSLFALFLVYLTLEVSTYNDKKTGLFSFLNNFKNNFLKFILPLSIAALIIVYFLF